MRLLGALLAMALAPQDTQPDRLPRIQRVAGEVRVWRASQRPVDLMRESDALEVAPTDKIGTRAAALAAQFAVDTGLLVLLKGVVAGEKTGLTVAREKNTLRLQLIQGAVAVQSFETEFEVKTAAGTLLGSRGTVLVNVVKDRTIIVPMSDSVTFDSGRGPVELRPGEVGETVAGRDTAKREAQPADVWLGSAQPAGRVNLLANPGFEKGRSGWDFGDCPDCRAELDAARAFSGQASATVVLRHLKRSGEGKEVHENPPMQTAALEKGRSYLLSFFIRCEKIRRDDEASPVEVELDLDEGGKRVKTFIEPVPVRDGVWEYFSMRFAAEGPDFKLHFRVPRKAGTYTGQFWLDDFFLTPLPPAAK